MIPENRLSRRGKAPLYKTNAHERSRAFRGEEEQQRARRPTKPPAPYYLPSVRAITWVGGRKSELRTLYEFAPFPLRGIFAMTTRRQPSARSAENPSAAWKPIYSPDSGKHPMRKTMTAVARDAAIWREHKRRQRSDEHDVIVAERKREVSPSRAEKRLPARRYAHTRRMKPRIERQLGAGFSHPRDDLAPRFSALGPRRRAPAKGGATMSRKPRYASFAPALGPGEQVKSSSTCTSTPPFAAIGAPIAAKQPSTHAFNSSNCSPSLM